QLEFEATLAEGEQIVIDTRPRRKTVRDGDGTNRFSSLSVGSVLWPLVPGPNVVDVLLTGLGDASRLELEITPLVPTALEVSRVGQEGPGPRYSPDAIRRGRSQTVVAGNDPTNGPGGAAAGTHVHL